MKQAWSVWGHEGTGAELGPSVGALTLFLQYHWKGKAQCKQVEGLRCCGELSVFADKPGAKELVKHGDKTLQTTREVFDYEKTGVDVAIKCAGVHWWYNSRSHAAELTAGYFNTRSGDFVHERDGYEPIVKICAKYNARLNFTCVEMVDGDHPWFSRCGPECLLRQIRTAAAKYNVRVAGENALCRFDRSAY